MPTATPPSQPGWLDDDPVDPNAVLTALEDDACRSILEAAQSEPLTATELSERCDVPTSTAYRKVEQLADAGLLESQIRINTTGKHATEYRTCVDNIVVSFGDDGIGVELTDPVRDNEAQASYATADD